MKKLDDKGFANFGTTVYGLNFYAFNQQSQNDNISELMESNLNSLQSLKARYIKFRMRSNSITCLENSPLISKYMKPKSLGINFCSIMGYDLNNVGNIKTTIDSLKRSTSSKVLSTLFKREFKNILEMIAKDNSYVDYLKANLNNILEVIDDKAVSHVIAQILRMFTKYNKELGDWIIKKLLDIHCNKGQVSLLYDLIKCNPKEFIPRLKIVQSFIFEHCEIVEKKQDKQPKDLLQLESFMRTFIDLVNVYSKNLQIEDWCNQVLTPEELEEKKKIDFQIFKSKHFSLIL